MRVVGFAACLATLWAGSAASPEQQVQLPLVPEPCDRELLVRLHRRTGPAVEAIAGVHFNFTSNRHYEVVEVVSVFHVDQLCRSALHFVESLRLAVSFLVCPGVFAPAPSSDDDSEARAHAALNALGLRRHLEQFFANLRFLATAGGETESAEAAQAWDYAEQELMEVSLRLEGWVMVSFGAPGQQLSATAYWNLDPLLHRVISMVADFLSSLTEDLGMLFRAPNYISHEMLPGTGKSADAMGSLLTVSVFANTTSGRVLKPDFMKAMQRPAAMLTQPAISPMFNECRAISTEAAAGPVPLEFVDRPASWAHRDVSGIYQRVPSPLQLLNAAAHHTRLSNLFISVQVSQYLLTPAPHCGSRLVLYDPSHCLLDHGWGGYSFELNPLPPFNFSVVYSGKPLGPGTAMPATDVHSIHVPSIDTQWSSLVSTFKSMNHHSPDFLFISPLAGNCQLIDQLLGTGTIRPKLVYLPINPLVPPPAESSPDFFKWWSGEGELLLRQFGTDVSASTEMETLPITTSVWLAQCSLQAAVLRLRRHGYSLLHVEHTFAAFVWRPLRRFVAGSSSAVADATPAEEAEPVDATRAAWLAGWHCSPHAPYLFDLQALLPGHAGSSFALGGGVPEGEPGTLPREEARRLAATVLQETPTLRYFLERSSEGQLPHGHCGEGECECFPPYRGQLCELEDAPRQPQKLRAVIHYITAETERDMVDLQRSLTSLWQRFNQHYDYPIVIFHEGLSPAARRRIISASENRVWLVLLPRFKEVPKEWANTAKQVAQDFSVGYCAMTRWRSGPVFLEPALAGFDYAMTLDTDSYFPADLAVDPFGFVHERGLKAAFPHLGRESASVVVNFLHYFLLYCRLLGLHPRRTQMLASLVESNFKWYQQCLMLDIEILRLDWFRGPQYQDMFRYMDSTGGFWLHRWGNNPFRTFAVALLLEDKDVRAVELPYAHQDYCSCGPARSPCDWNAEHGIYECREVPGSPKGTIGVSDLAEGLLDLQPWRGTERQKSKFIPQDILQFVDEHVPP